MYKFNTCRGNQTKRDELEVLMNKINTYLKRFSTPLKSRRTQRHNQKEVKGALEKLQKNHIKQFLLGMTLLFRSRDLQMKTQKVL